MTALPFSHLNLRKNPFGELSVCERVQIAYVDLEAALEHLKRKDKHGRGAVLQVVGEKGFGKSTHLLSIAARLPDAAYVYLPEDSKASIPRHGNPLLIDEAQRLTMWQRLQIFRSPRTLVLGTHVDFTRTLQRQGRIVFTLSAERHTTPQRVSEILNARIEAARRSGGAVPRITFKTAEQLFEQFGPDLRSIEHSLYDTFQNLRSIQDV
jgi:hypothetical protein